MIFRYRICILLFVFVSFARGGNAQNVPIGSWTGHLPYNNALGVATDGTTLFTICNQAFFTYNITSGEPPETYSKVNGMSDVGMQCVAYDQATGVTVLVYNNGNIDLFKSNSFYNIPDLRLKVITEEKKVYHVYTDNGSAYLCTTLGLIVIDLVNYNISQSYQFNFKKKNVPVVSFTRAGDFYYLAADTGLFRIDKNNPRLQDLQEWQRLDSSHSFSRIENVNNTLFLYAKKQVFALQADTVRVVYTSKKDVRHINKGGDNLMIGVADSTGGSLRIMNTGFAFVDSFSCTDSSTEAVQLADNSIWVATPVGGLKLRTGPDQVTALVPGGPTSAYAYDIYAHDGHVYIAHGGYNSSYYINGNLAGISYQHGDKWTYYRTGLYPPMNGVKDMVALVRNEKTGTLYAGSYLNGLIIINSDGSSPAISQSVFDGSVAYGKDAHQLLGLALDRHDNLWITTMFADHELYVKTADDKWYGFLVPGIVFGGPVVVDDSDQVWIGGGFTSGLAVYNTNHTIDNPADDIGYHLTNGSALGNLPAAAVSALAKDKQNQIWVGTNNGVAVVRNCLANIAGGSCAAETPVVTYDQHTGPLLEGRLVKTIAVDGADQKWIGTTTDGVWVLSADGQTVVKRYTMDNSPLPSNFIQKITIDKITGEVYIGTDMGIVSYRGTTTESAESNHAVKVFPSPVPSGYTGAIIIKDVLNNSDVRITDINGQLVYRTKAVGGQVVWNGNDYTGHRPQTGVYLVFVSGNEGKDTYSGKIIFMQ